MYTCRIYSRIAIWSTLGTNPSPPPVPNCRTVTPIVPLTHVNRYRNCPVQVSFRYLTSLFTHHSNQARNAITLTLASNGGKFQPSRKPDHDSSKDTWSTILVSSPNHDRPACLEFFASQYIPSLHNTPKSFEETTHSQLFLGSTNLWYIPPCTSQKNTNVSKVELSRSNTSSLRALRVSSIAHPPIRQLPTS